MGRGRNGRACRAVMSVARRVGGRGDSTGSIRRDVEEEGGVVGFRFTYCPSPLRRKWPFFWHLELLYPLKPLQIIGD